jgi:hypothetical protein
LLGVEALALVVVVEDVSVSQVYYVVIMQENPLRRVDST